MANADPFLRSLGFAVKKLRESQGLTQEALAEKADLDRTYLSDIERGGRNPGIKNVARLAKALDVTPSRLLEGVAL